MYDDLHVVYDGTDDFQQYVAAYQSLIDSGMAWRECGSVGREAMSLIRQGFCTLGETGHHDYYGNYVPSRHEVKPGTLGSKQYADAHRPD